MRRAYRVSLVCLVLGVSTADSWAGDERHYQPEGRRDPFVSLVASQSGGMRAQRGEGLAGVLVDEVRVRGVAGSVERLVAMIEGPDGKTLIVHQGDRLRDGVITRILPQGLVLEQTIATSMSRAETREVQKWLRVFEAGGAQP